MATPARVRQTGNLPSADIEGLESLTELALDLRWSWNHATDTVWRQLDAGLWELAHNPWVVRQTVSRDKIDRVWPIPPFAQPSTT
jgi:starch phosphorylase